MRQSAVTVGRAWLLKTRRDDYNERFAADGP